MSALQALAAHVGSLPIVHEDYAAHIAKRRFAIHAGFGSPGGSRSGSSSGKSRSLVDGVATQIGAGSPSASPVKGKKHPPKYTRRSRLGKRRTSSWALEREEAEENDFPERRRRSVFDGSDEHFELDDDYTGPIELEFQEDFMAIPTATQPPLHKRSATPTAASNWVDGATGTVYAKLNNGTRTRLTDASNIFVVEGGGDTSNGGVLEAQIRTQPGKDVTAPFWLINETGDFCTNSATTSCYITLAKGLNDAPYSLVPMESDTTPEAIWSIDSKTGVLSATFEGESDIVFTQNENELCVRVVAFGFTQLKVEQWEWRH